MRIFDWDRLSPRERAEALARPQAAQAPEVAQTVREIVDAVRRGGDAAVQSYTERLDGVTQSALAVTPAEFDAARRALTGTQVEALEIAIDNVRKFHARQRPVEFGLETTPGVRCELLVRPLGSVGLYIPGGSAPLPSTLVMLAVPAAIAGCPQRVVCTPPSRFGGADPAVLVAAELLGLDTVFKMGGAQAIAALAYGTESVPKVDKIFGPGNVWVTAAKQQFAQDPRGAACDLPAGPSEVLVIADEKADAEFVAADLLAQAEHDPLAQSILITPSLTLARAVAKAIERDLPQLSRRGILALSVSACRCLLVADLATAFGITNTYAPEHLILQVQDARRWLPEVRNAGAVFLGAWSPEALGDYCTGTNHVLPTYGYARTFSGLTVRDFMRTMSVQELTPSGLRALGPTAATLARLEGLDAHELSVTRRLESLAGTGA